MSAQAGSMHDARTRDAAGAAPRSVSVEDLARARTPLLRLARATPEVLLKPEWYGPTGSVYDRLYPALFDEAEAAGRLAPGVQVLEAGSSVAVFACATAAARRRHACTVVFPAGSSEDAAGAVRATGATVILTPGGESDVGAALRRGRGLLAANPDGFWMPDHHGNPRAVDVMATSLGAEVADQAGPRVGALVAAVGCGTVLTAVARSLLERNPAVRIYAVEPAECALLSGGRWGPHVIPGFAPGFVPEGLDLALLSGVIVVTARERVTVGRRLAREEGLRVGAAAGTVVAAAFKLAERHPELPSIVALAEHGR